MQREKKIVSIVNNHYNTKIEMKKIKILEGGNRQERHRQTKEIKKKIK